jgi:hypothetical protein
MPRRAGLDVPGRSSRSNDVRHLSNIRPNVLNPTLYSLDLTLAESEKRHKLPTWDRASPLRNVDSIIRASRRLRRKTMTIWPRVLLLILAFLCASCTAPVAFVSPCAPGPDPNNNSCQPSFPVTQTKMAFDSNFSPSNSLSVTFNGQDITSALSPPPAPNGTSTAGLPRPPNPSYYTTATQTLQANATCGFFCVYPTKTVTFTPPGIAISAAGQNFPNIPVSASLSAPSNTNTR